MKRLLFFSDPHLGLNRAAHTTTASRARLRQAIGKTLDYVLAVPADHYFCLGDLFDTYQVSPIELVAGYRVLEKCTLALRGNHDMSNRSDSLSSHEAIATIRSSPYQNLFVTEDKNLRVIGVHHQLTQALFLAELDKVLQFCRAAPATNTILLLHCNYESPYELSESTLNLTADKVPELLKVFDYVLIGHEHATRSLFKGRLLLLGNIHPTSFADITDKFYWTLDVYPDGLEPLQPHKLWDRGGGYAEVPVEVLLDPSYTVSEGLQFVTVTGSCESKRLPAVAKRVADLWQQSDQLLMVRNQVTALGSDIEPQAFQTLEVSVPDRITAALRGGPLEALWSSYLTRIIN